METIRRIYPVKGQRVGTSLTAQDILQWLQTGKRPVTRPIPAVQKEKFPVIII